MTCTDADHIREMIAVGKAKPLPIQVSRDFANYLESLPLLMPLGASLDWSRMPVHTSLEWYEKSDEELVTWVRSLRLGRFNHVALWYNSNEPCLLTGFEFGVTNLDTLTWGAPGPRYLFGVDVQGSEQHYSFDAILEVTGGRLLFGVM